MSPRCSTRCGLARGLTPVLLLSAGLTALGSAAPALGQERETLEPIEAGVADVDPLAASLRNLQLDLRAPSDFDQVYRVPGRDDLLMRVDGGLYAVFSLSEYLPGAAGLITLVPSNTIYFIGPPHETDDLQRLVPPPIPITAYNELPRDTVVDAPRVEHPPIDRRRDTLTSSRIELRFGADGAPEAAPGPDPADVLADRLRSRRDFADILARGATADHGPAILTDAAYRSSRLRSLMRRAADAAQEQANYAARGPRPSSSSSK